MHFNLLVKLVVVMYLQQRNKTAIS